MWHNDTENGKFAAREKTNPLPEISEKNKELIDGFIARMQADNCDRRYVQRSRLNLTRMACEYPDLSKTGEAEFVAHINKLKATGYEHHWIYKRKVKGPDGQIVLREEPVIRRGHYSASTIANVKICVKAFHRWLNQGELPRWARNIKVEKTDAPMNPDDCLTLNEVGQLAGATTNTRDKALVWVLYETGGRITEVLGMKRKDVKFDQAGAMVVLHTLKTRKTEKPARQTRIYHGMNPLAEWMASMANKDGEAFVWCNQGMTRDQPVEAFTIRRLLIDLGRRAGINKELHPHLFRHSRATELSPVLNEADMRIYFGWSATSDMPSHYTHRKAKDIDNLILANCGVKVQTSDHGLVECTRCRRRNPSKFENCLSCGFPLTDKEAKAAVEDEKNLIYLGKAMRVLKQDDDFRQLVEKLMQKFS